jgi:oxygen-independent coproporphyrinogen-3 oxidase
VSWGVYVHIPFCRSRCTYCDFVTVTGADRDMKARYYAALLAEWAGRTVPDGPVVSVYFGGGTPSLADPSVIARILEAIAARARLAPRAEITLETNPGTVDAARLRAYRAVGVNRLSIGVQAVQSHHLLRLRRGHRVEDARAAVAEARAAGFENVSADAIYGLPGQSLAEWQETVRALLDWGVDHLSLYALSVEPGTVLARQVDAGEAVLPDPEIVADMADWATEAVERRGLYRYEIANFARPGFESVHNRLYWTLEPYVGLGAGAHSFDGRRRRWNHRGLHAYIDAALGGRDPAAGEETRDLPALMGEYVWLGLRLRRGVSDAGFRARFGISVADAFPGAVAWGLGRGLLQWEAGHLKATARGFDVWNQVAERFLEALPEPAGLTRT